MSGPVLNASLALSPLMLTAAQWNRSHYYFHFTLKNQALEELADGHSFGTQVHLKPDQYSDWDLQDPLPPPGRVV